MLEHAFIMDSLILVLQTIVSPGKRTQQPGHFGHFGPCRVTAVLDLASKMGNSW